MPENTDNLESLPVEDLEVQRQHTPSQTSIGSKEFNEALVAELNGGQLWRTSKALGEKLKVDVVELDKFLRNQLVICSRASKKEGVFLYALVKRLEQVEKPKVDPKVEAALRPLVTEEDRYALSSLHNAHIILHNAMNQYAMKIHERNPEAFTSLAEAKNKLEAGIAMLAVRLKADLSKLPKV